MIKEEAARRGVALTALSDYYLARAGDSSLLLLGYARSSEAVIRAGVRELAAAVVAVRGAVPAGWAVAEGTGGPSVAAGRFDLRDRAAN